MSRNIAFANEEFYHLYNRGTEKRTIFSSKADYNRFLSLLYLCNNLDSVHISNHQGLTLMELLTVQRKDTLTRLCAYCLMPNHFHLLVQEKIEGGTSLFMQKLSTGYTMYFNRRYERTGSLFQGTFKMTHSEDDRYLKYLISYVHLNPIKIIEPSWKETGIANRKAAEKFLNDYSYSSFLDYTGTKRFENAIVDTQALPKYFDSPVDFKNSVSEWLAFHQG